MSDNLSFVLMAFIFGGGFVLIVRSLLDYRRTAVLVRVQADAHVKLMEKLASSQELLGYMETEAGKHFLQLVTWSRSASRARWRPSSFTSSGRSGDRRTLDTANDGLAAVPFSTMIG